MSADHDHAARETLRLIGPDPANWVPDRPGIDHNVVLVGGGQTGTTFGFALRRAGIGKVSIIDAASDENGAGVWLTRARMERLRTPKGLPGPELGLPGLSFQTWYEARHGQDAYASFDRISRRDWAAYLKWYREFLALPVRYGTRLTRIEPAADHLRLHLEINGKPSIETTRKLILGTGVTGSGGAQLPPALSDLPKDFVAHTSDLIDFERLRGKTVAVVGAAASAFDAAGTALEAGAASVHLFARRQALANVPINRVRGYPGAYDNYAHLPDAVRWHQAIRFADAGSTPPADSVERATRHTNFHLHLGAPWTTASVVDGQIHTVINDAPYRFDFVIAGTGYFADPAARPELSEIAPDIRLWRDQYTPPAGEENAYFGAHPYLGFAHEFLEKSPGTAPRLADIHLYNPGGFVSFGLPIGDVPSIRRDVPKIVRRISRDLFLTDLPQHEARITGTFAPEFEPDIYAGSVWQTPETQAAE